MNNDLEQEDWPPTRFNLIGNAYRPGWGFPTMEGLAKSIQGLVDEGRYRSAMDGVFTVLASNPNHQEALMLALIIIGATSRTQRIQSQEPLTPRYLGDRRLDPLYAVCSRCKLSMWVPVNCLFRRRGIHTFGANPTGMQCYTCGYVVCRQCLDRVSLGVGTSVISDKCPNPGCQHSNLQLYVYPTGRTPQQMARINGTVSQVFLLRSGPIPPDIEFMRNLLETYSPDALDDGAELVGLAVIPWPDHIEKDFAPHIYSWQQKGNVIRGSIRDRAQILDDRGNSVYLVKLGKSNDPDAAGKVGVESISALPPANEKISNEEQCDAFNRTVVCEIDREDLLSYLRGRGAAEITTYKSEKCVANRARFKEALAGETSSPHLTYFILKANDSRVSNPHLIVATGDKSAFDVAWNYNSEPIRDRVLRELSLPTGTWESMTGSGTYANHSKPGCSLASRVPFDNLAIQILQGLYQLVQVIRPVHPPLKKSQRWQVMIFGEPVVRPDMACQVCGDDRVSPGFNGSHLHCTRCDTIYCRRNCMASIHGQCPKCGETDRINGAE